MVQASERTIVARALFRLLGQPPRALYAVGLGSICGREVLLLTTRGRRTGEARVTPLQYERVDGKLIVGSARGEAADWFRNVLADPYVEIQVGRSHSSGIAETCIDPSRIADFLELRLQRHPRLVGGIMRLHGVPQHPDRSQLEVYASRLAIVTITPTQAGVQPS